MRISARRRRERAAEGHEAPLRELLEAEQRLEGLVRAASDAAARTVAAAHAARDERRAAARDAADAADAERARADRAAHDAAIAAVDAAVQAVIDGLTPSDQQVDDLARWALAQAIHGPGAPP